MKSRRGRQEPTAEFILAYTKTKGGEAVELYNSTGRTAQEWQANVLADMMAVDDNGLWVHSRFGFSVPRQNGKNEIIVARQFYGLTHGERMLHTAHRTATSRAAWERLCYLLGKAGIREIKGDVKSGYRSGKSKGQEWIEMDEDHGGGKIHFRTRSTTGGLGETFDTLFTDEAQEYQDDQESALKYTIVSSQNPQTILFGTPPTPYSSGTIFPRFRESTLCGEKKHAGWVEWSVDDMSDPGDIDLWYETNPSLGYTLTERAIEDEIGADDVDFNVQRLGLWLRYNQKSVITQNDWEKCRVDKIPDFFGKFCIGIKFAIDGTAVSMAAAVRTVDGETLVECVDRRLMRDGVDWIADFISATKENHTKVVVDGANGAELLTAALKARKIKAPYRVTVKDVISANAFFMQGIYQKSIHHTGQPSLTGVATNCEKRAIGTGGGYGFKSLQSERDISILDSVALAAWGCDQFRATAKQQISY